jgi:hypothetical protein
VPVIDHAQHRPVTDVAGEKRRLIGGEEQDVFSMRRAAGIRS